MADPAGNSPGNEIGPDVLESLRGRVRAYLRRSGVGSQTRLAVAANVQGGTLSKFLSGKGRLNRTNYINLQLALGALDRKAA